MAENIYAQGFDTAAEIRLNGRHIEDLLSLCPSPVTDEDFALTATRSALEDSRHFIAELFSTPEDLIVLHDVVLSVSGLAQLVGQDVVNKAFEYGGPDDVHAVWSPEYRTAIHAVRLVDGGFNETMQDPHSVIGAVLGVVANMGNEDRER